MEGSNSVREMLESPDPYRRRGACEAISEGRMEEFVPALVNAVRDGDPGVREAAINALSSLGGERVAEAMAPLLREESSVLRNIAFEILELLGPDAFNALAKLLADEDDGVVKFAVDIISNTRDARSVAFLCPLVSHRNPNVRASAAVCLGKLRSTDSVPVLLNALKDPEEWVRFSAVEGLGLIQDRRALEPLTRMTETDTGLIKEAAIDAVAKMASVEDAAGVLMKLEALIRKGKSFSAWAVVDLLEKVFSPGSDFRPAPDFKQTYFNFLTKAFEDDDRPGRLRVLRGFALLRLPDGLEHVFRFIDAQNEIDEDTEGFLVDAMVCISGRRVPPVLNERARQGGKALRIIVRAFGEMRSVAAVPILKDLVGRVAKNEQREIVAALEKIGSASSTEVLYQFLERSDGHTRKIAARALASLEGAAAVTSLFEALRKEVYRDVMEEITDSLAGIPSDSVRKGLCALLAESSGNLREMGARGLGLIGDEDALEALKGAAADSDPSVRKAAYKSMARLGIPYAIDEIVKGLADESDEVKLSVLKGLSGWSGEKIKSALVNALADGNIWVRYHSVLLIGEMGGHELEGLIVDKLVKDEAPVKAAAAKALERLGAKGALKTLMGFVTHPDPSVRGAVESAIESLKC